MSGLHQQECSDNKDVVVYFWERNAKTEKRSLEVGNYFYLSIHLNLSFFDRKYFEMFKRFMVM